ncbi:MAG: hypothetical protein JW744_01810 [Candidatus Diapherotrites archaeon]|uniref:Uncharacterized protein n=1 Tax=Candidatus Iainarchaeum sp. TaxID=3101447 RepID=A0A938YWX5_9ARCH|nr:hypothetical protein [Candidatus Diapherotrites archaeon]
MVNKQVVLDTIRKMFDSGIDDSVVKQTLLDIGLSEDEISAFMAEAKGVDSGEEEPEAEEDYEEPVERKVSRQIADEHAAQEAMHATTHAAIDGHGARLDALGEKIGSVEEKLGKIDSQTLKPSNKDLVDLLAASNQRLASLERQVSDLKALNMALKSIMEKILETDRKILGKL